MEDGNRIFGYARVSSKEQHLDRQILELQKHVKPENILVDKASGKNLERESYQALKGVLGLRRGDILYICSLDRLSRNKSDIKKELEYFRENGIRLMVLDLPTTMIEVPEGQSWIMDMINNILIEVLASIAQQEREMILKRQKEGIEAARLKKVHLGRPKAEYPDQWDVYYVKWKEGEITAVEMMEKLGLKRTTFYELVKRYTSR